MSADAPATKVAVMSAAGSSEGAIYTQSGASAAGVSEGADYASAAGSAGASAASMGVNAPDGVLLIHGLGGTQYDMGSMHKRLKNGGLVTHSLTLPGHGTKAEDLVG